MRTHRADSILRKKLEKNACWHRRSIFALTACLFLSMCGVTFAQTSSGAPALSISSTSISFGDVAVGQTVSKAVTLTSTGTVPVTISGISVVGSLFTTSGVAVPLTLNPGQTATLNLSFYSPHVSSFTGIVTIASDSSGGNVVINTSANGVSGTSALAASSTNVDFGNVATGQSAKQAITLTATGSVPVTISGLSVAGSLFAASGIATPLTLNPGQTATLNLSFYADHASTFTGILTIANNSSAGNIVVNMAGSGVAGASTLGVSSTNVNFGNVATGQTAKQTITLSSTGNAPVTISSLSVAGSLFTTAGVTTPTTLNPGQTATLTLQFYADHASTFTGILTIASNATPASTIVNMTGTGAAGLSALSCANASMAGGGTDVCTVTLSGAAPSSGLVVALASSNAAVTVPAAVTVASGSTTGAFNAITTAVTTAQAATLTATAGSTSQTFALQLNTGSAGLTLSSTNIAFGNVVVGSPATQAVTLTASGTAPVTVNSATATGTGFTVSGMTFPTTLNAGQTATLNVQFNPTVSGAATGQVTVSSSATGSGTNSVSLTGTGTYHQVSLTWDAPSGSANPISGYNVYRAPSGSSSYTMLNSSPGSQTTYTDSNAQTSTTYQYYVTAVDSTGAESTPSNTATVAVP